MARIYTRRRALALAAATLAAPRLSWPGNPKRLSIDDYLLANARGLEILGGKPPTERDIRSANVILDAAPTSSPFDVALYFESLKDKNENGDPFNCRWPVRANPVILAFFTATTTGNPGSDSVSWCSAFVNWCLQRANRARTNCAVAQSFLCYSKATSPAVGQIAVFKKTGGSGCCSETGGHVAFYLGESGDEIHILGGNQCRDGEYCDPKKTNRTCVTRMTRPRRNEHQHFDSVREIVSDQPDQPDQPDQSKGCD